MVLVAPHPVRPQSELDASDGGDGTTVLALLRGDTSARPRFDPGLAGGLRAWLEDAAYEAVVARGEHAPPLFVGPRQLFGAPGERGGAGASDDVSLSRLVHALFRQLVHTGQIDDPLCDALEALRAAEGNAIVRHVESLPAPVRAVLAEALAAHAANLMGQVPRFAPGWMPRTDDRVATPLAGGRVVLHGVFDLIVGLAQRGTASLCALGLSTGGSWAWQRRSLHYLALLEAVRSGTPPFRLALLDSSTGRYGVEDMREEHLRAMASHIAAWLTRNAAVDA